MWAGGSLFARQARHSPGDISCLPDSLHLTIIDMDFALTAFETSFCFKKGVVAND